MSSSLRSAATLGRRKRWPRLDSLVAVEWVDIVATINSELADAIPCPCTTTGRLVKKTDEFIVIATSIFHEPGAEIMGDFVAIPIGVVRTIRPLPGSSRRRAKIK